MTPTGGGRRTDPATYRGSGPQVPHARRRWLRSSRRSPRDFASSDNEVLEPGFEKVALFVNASGVPTHAVRLLLIGLWTSKLGEWEDIEHELHALAGGHLRHGRPVAQAAVPGAGGWRILIERPTTGSMEPCVRWAFPWVVRKATGWERFRYNGLEMLPPFVFSPAYGMSRTVLRHASIFPMTASDRIPTVCRMSVWSSVRTFQHEA